MKTIQFTLAALLCALVITVKPVMAEEYFTKSSSDPMTGSSSSSLGVFDDGEKFFAPLQAAPWPYDRMGIAMLWKCWNKRAPELFFAFSQSPNLDNEFVPYGDGLQTTSIMLKASAQDAPLRLEALIKTGATFLSFSAKDATQIREYLEGSSEVYIRVWHYNGQGITYQIQIADLSQYYSDLKAACKN